MSKIATIKTLVESLPGNQQHDPLRPSDPHFNNGLDKAKKMGWAVHRDGRCYVPEALRGKGVGYGGKRRG